MAYIGVQPTDTYLSISSQQITGTGSATYTLDYSVSTEEDVAVFVNNVRQNVSSYTVSGTSLTLGGTISASDSCWVLFLGRTVGTKTPAVGSVTNDMLAGSIATSKLADGSTFATTNGITMADTWRLTTDFNGANTDPEFITTNLERDDTTSYGSIGTGMSESSGVFTFPSTGIYYVTFTVSGDLAGDNWNIYIYVTTDNSTYNIRSQTMIGDENGRENSGITSCLIDVTDTSNVKLKLAVGGVAGVSGSSVYGNTSKNITHAQFIRLGDT